MLINKLKIMTIYIIRHCETLGNKLNRIGGEKEVLLTLKGISQAQSIGNRLLNEEEDFSKYIFISSPLARTRHTLQIVMEILGVEDKDIIEEPLLKTKFKGAFDNISKKDIERLYPGELDKKAKDPWNWCPPGNGESFASEFKRVKEFQEKYKNEKNIVLCSHEGVCSVLKEIFDGKSDEEIKKIRNGLKYDQNYFYSYNEKNGLKKL